MKMIKDFVFDPKEVRRQLGLNQQEFWSRIGVTQSGGSRYESGRRMPKPVQELLRVVHVEKIDLNRIHREDLDVLDFVKTQRPELFEQISAELAKQAAPKKVEVQSHPRMVPPAVRPILAEKQPVAAVKSTPIEEDGDLFESYELGSNDLARSRPALFEESRTFAFRRRS